MLTISNAIWMARINSEGEERRKQGLSYVKAAPVTRTIADSVDLALNHERYGLTATETSRFLETMNGYSNKK